MLNKDKIVSRELLVPLIEELKAAGKKIGYTSGAFDILHAGHVEYLEIARSKCDFLIVAVNSDASVKSYKNPNRPINPQAARAQVISALGSVDRVFIFDELNNNQNIQILKPDFYFKAGDYSKEKLSSASIVESYGGKVELISFKSGYSSTNVIEKISNEVLDAFCAPLTLKSAEPAPVIFLDRDGTLNEDISYLHEPSKLKLIEGTNEALKILSDAGYLLVMVTNQPGIGLGYFSKEDFYKLTRAFFSAIAPSKAKFAKVYFCPHSESDNCQCRKPGTYLLERAAKEMNIDMANSYMVGDMTSDIQAGINFGIKTVLVGGESAGKDGKYDCKPAHRFESLLEAAKYLSKQKQ